MLIPASFQWFSSCTPASRGVKCLCTRAFIIPAHLEKLEQILVVSSSLVIWTKTKFKHKMRGCLLSHFRSCPALCNPMDCGLLGSSVHGILQARIREWLPMPFSRGSSWCRDRSHVSMSPGLTGRFFSISTTQEAPNIRYLGFILLVIQPLDS